MQPSSLIFLLVIAIWAAYLVKHWLRRREHLSTARTMDRFSHSMRILDRTKAGRASAPGAVSAGSVPLHRRSARFSVAEVAGGATMAVEVPQEAPAPTPAPAGRPVGRTRAVVGGVFVAAAGLTLAGMVLAAVGAVGWLLPGLAALVCVVSFVVLRRIAARPARRAGSGAAANKAAASRAAASRAAASKAAASKAAGKAAGAGAAADRARVAPAAAPARSAASARAQARDTVYDLAELDPSAPPAAAKAEAATEPVPGGWSPVPVPPPTYTLKAKAVYPTPLEDADDDDVASPYAVAEPAGRRRVSG